MKDRAPAFQFYPRQFAADDHVMAMDLDAVGAHILLMCAAAASPEVCRIHADERAIRTRLRNPSEQDWQRIKSQLLGGAWKLSEDSLWWEQHGLRRTFEKQKAFSQQQRERAKGRWPKNEAEALPEGCRNDAERLPDTMPEVCSSSSSSSSILLSSEPCGSDGAGCLSKEQKSRKPSPEAERLAALLQSEILRNKPDYRIKQSQLRNWAGTADRMMRLDGRTEESIANLIRWVQRDEFWMANCLSMDTMREKFDQLELKSGRPSSKNQPTAAAAPDYVPASQKFEQRLHAGRAQA